MSHSDPQMTYRIENLDSDGRNSELCLVRSKNMRRTTLQVIGKCFIGLGAVGIVVLWIQLERWQSTSNVLFPILFCLGLIAMCFGGYLLSFPFHKWVSLACGPVKEIYSFVNQFWVYFFSLFSGFQTHCEPSSTQEKQVGVLRWHAGPSGCTI